MNTKVMRDSKVAMNEEIYQESRKEITESDLE